MTASWNTNSVEKSVMDAVPMHTTNGTSEGFASRADATVGFHRTRSVYRLTQGEDGSIYAADGGSFSPEGYSLFKHGDDRWARRFGYEVADLLMDAEADLFDRVRPDEVLIAAFPYKYISTAAASMVDHVLTRLNHVLGGEGKPAVGHLHAFKYPWQASVEHHFPGMGEEDRRRILDKVELSIDESRLLGAHLVVVDDVRVTGASRDRFLRLLYQVKGLSSLTVVFLCEVDPTVAKADPAIESRLNHAKVKTLDDVAEIVESGEFRWNIRVAKFVLEQPEAERFGAFVHGLRDDLLLALYRLALLNEYHRERNYERHIKTIRAAVEARGIV